MDIISGAPLPYLISIALMWILYALKPSRRWAAWQQVRKEAKRQKRITVDLFGMDLHCK